MAVITISRQYGSGDDEIAAQVRELLGDHFFDNCEEREFYPCLSLPAQKTNTITCLLFINQTV